MEKKNKVSFGNTKYTYFNITEMITAIKPHLEDLNLLILQPHITNEFGDFIQTQVIDVDSGQMVTSNIRIACPPGSDSQKFGSATTYARRYDLQSLLFIEADDDDGIATIKSSAEYKVESKPLSSPGEYVIQHKHKYNTGKKISEVSKTNLESDVKFWSGKKVNGPLVDYITNAKLYIEQNPN